jgi:Glyoxalase-like domain
MSESLPKPRPIDHVVIAVRDLKAARAAYGRLGFTVTPVARHPFGTANALVQFDGAYLELLAVVDPAAIPEPTATAFSFGAFNRDFLERGDGLSMLALHSTDAAADRTDYDCRDLPVYDPFHFERMAEGPDGVERKVAFSLTYTGDARFHGGAGFFTCQHHFPENFWRPEYQRHANGAGRVDAAVLVAGDPTDFHEFFTHFTGQHDMRSTSLGNEFDLGGGKLEVMTPVAYRAFFGAETTSDPRRFMALRIAVADLSATRAHLKANAVPFTERAAALVVPAEAACGAAIAFVQA